MRPLPRRISILPLLLAEALVLAPPLWAERRAAPRIIEPRPLRLQWEERFVRMEAEEEREETRWPADGIGQDQSVREFRPSMGLGFSGSVYHPNLVEFRGQGEVGVTEGSRRLETEGVSAAETEDRNFDSRNYDFTADLLKEKPLATTLFARETRDRREYDQFRSFTTETRQFGGRMSLPLPGMPGDLGYTDQREDLLDPDRPLTRLERTLHLQLTRNAGEGRRTAFRANRHEFEQEEEGRAPYTGDSLTASLSRSDRFGAADRARNQIDLSVDELNTSLSERRSLTFRDGLSIQHSETFVTGYHYLFDRREVGDSTTDRHDVDAHAEHQLYESLSSRWGVEARTSRVSGSDAGQGEDRYGPYLSETYRKRLGDWGVLVLAGDAKSLEQRLSSSSNEILVVDETVVFSKPGPQLLRTPDVQAASVVVSDARRGTLYREGVDYRLVRRGNRMEIQRLFAGAIPSEAPVAVDYRADSGGDQEATTLETGGSAELSLWERRWVFRIRNRRMDIRGDATSSFQNEAETTAGVEYNRGGLTSALEWVDHTADYLSYRGTRAHAQYTHPVGAVAAVVVDAGRDDLTYEQGGARDTERADLTLVIQPGSALRLNLRGGWYRETEAGDERTLTVAEGGLEYRIGRLLTSAVLKFEDDAEPGQDRSRRYAYVRATREF